MAAVSQAPQHKPRNRVAFPKAPKSGRSSNMSEIQDSMSNPFRMPKDQDIFSLRDRERQRKKQQRILQRELRAEEKTTYTTRINAKTKAMVQPIESDSEESEQDQDGATAVKDDPQFTLAVTRDRHVEKESLADYITKKREMFLVQYSLGVKRDEMRKLEEIAAAEERKLELAEQYLEEDAAMFDEFLKENDKKSVEAIKIAESEAKAKLEKVAEIKKIVSHMMIIKGEISKDEDTLKEYQLYKEFLEALTPKEWMSAKDLAKREKKEEAMRRAAEKEAEKIAQISQKKSDSVSSEKVKKKSSNVRSPSQSSMKKSSALESSIEEESDSEAEEPKLYFTDPQQLLDIFAELEESNLSLIQNSQETEEALEEIKQTIKTTQQKMEKETEILKDQIDKLNSAIQREEEKAKELEIKASKLDWTKLRIAVLLWGKDLEQQHDVFVVKKIVPEYAQRLRQMFSFGEFKAEDQEKMLAALNKKVEDVYRSCIGDNEANLRNEKKKKKRNPLPGEEVKPPPTMGKNVDKTKVTLEETMVEFGKEDPAKFEGMSLSVLQSTLQMLTNIENRLEELFEQIEMMPQDKVEAAEKAKDKERRLKMREEKMEQQKLHQEERVRRALERAKADPKKYTGRKLVVRSEPPQLKKEEDDKADQQSREEEELAYFFTP